MLNDATLNLLTAAVDGELNPAESLQLRQELEASPEAQQLFARLQSDRARLRALPPVLPPVDLQDRVLAAIATATPPIPFPAFELPRHPVAEPARVPFARVRDPKAWRWVPAFVAASLLIGVAVSSFLFFRDGSERNLAKAVRGNHGADHGEAGKGFRHSSTGGEIVPAAPFPHSPGAGGAIAGPEVPRNVTGAEAVALAPTPRVVRPDLLGGSLLPETHFDRVELRVPFLKPLADLEREDTRDLFAEELSLDSAFRIDLFARNPHRGIELFRAAANAAGVTLHLDATSLALLQKRNTNTVVLYTESLSPSELVNLLARLAAEDSKVSPRVFESLHAVPVSSADEKDLRAVLGTDPGLFKRPRAEAESHTKPGLDGKPISAGTADHIVKSLTTGKGKGGEKSAVLMTWGPQFARTPPLASAELKAFMSKRGERKPDAVPVMIVIRPGN